MIRGRGLWAIELAQHLQAILLGHPQVENQNVGAKLLVKPASFLPVAGLAHHLQVVLQPQDGHQPFTDHRMIIGDQDPYAGLLCGVAEELIKWTLGAAPKGNATHTCTR